MKNILYFTIAILGVGGIARLIDGPIIDIQQPGIGQLIWLVSPLLIALLFRVFTKNPTNWGLRPQLARNASWYLLSVLIFPVLTAILILGGVSVESVIVDKPLLSATLLTSVLLGIPGIFIKNIFEEFVWRGYLFSTLEHTSFSRIQQHLIIGVVWGLWHLPYLDAFTQLYHDRSPFLYVPLFLIGVVLTSIIYGEIRFRSGSVWTAVLLHTFANAAVNPLFFEKYLHLFPGREWWIAPTIDNLGYLLLVGLVAAFFYLSNSHSPFATSSPIPYEMES